MKYINLPVSVAREELVLQATLEQIGIWFLLLCYCHEQMNGGMIKGCHKWPDSMWQRVAGTTAEKIAQESPLWHMSSMVLAIHHYDQEAEDAYRKKQRLGKMYVERRWAAERAKKIIKLESENYEKTQKNNSS